MYVPDFEIRRVDGSFIVDMTPAGPQDVAAAVNAAVAAQEAAEAAQAAAEAALAAVAGVGGITGGVAGDALFKQGPADFDSIYRRIQYADIDAIPRTLNYLASKAVTPNFTGADTPSLRSAAINAAALEAAGGILLLPSAAVSSALALSGVREVRGVDNTRPTFDFTSRTSQGTLVSSTGTVSVTTYALNADAIAGQSTIQLLNSVFGPSGAVAGTWMKISRNTGEAPLAPTHMGEYIHIDKNGVEIVGLNNVIHLDRPLRLSYPVSDGAVVQIVTFQPGILFNKIDVIGTANQWTDTSGDDDGDHGITATVCEEFITLDCNVHFCERNGIRSSGNLEAFSDRCSVEFSKPHYDAQIQYGFAAIGTSRLNEVSNFRCKRGRHGVAHSGSGPGFMERLTDRNCVIEDTYSTAFAEHDGLLERVSTDCVSRWCGNGWDYRGRGSRKLVNPEVYSTVISRPTDVGTVSSAGAALVLVDNAGDIEIWSPRFSDVQYLMQARNEVGTENFAYDGTAPQRISVFGGFCDQFTNGFYGIHTGSENVELDPGTWNTTPMGPFYFEGVKLLCSGRPATPTTSVRPFSFEGYVLKVEIVDCDVEFPAAVNEYYAVLFQASGELSVSGGKYARTRGILYTAKSSVKDETGTNITVTPTRFAMPAWPDWKDIKSGDAWLNSSVNRVTTPHLLPPAFKIGGDAPPITAPNTTAESIVATITNLRGWWGKRGSLQFEILATVTLNTNAKNLRVRIGGLTGTIIHQTNMNNATNGTWRIRGHFACTDYAVQVGPPIALTTFGSNSGTAQPGAVDLRTDQALVITVEKATAGDSVVINDYDFSLQPG